MSTVLCLMHKNHKTKKMFDVPEAFDFSSVKNDEEVVEEVVVEEKKMMTAVG